MHQTNKGNQLILAHIKAQDIQPLQYFLTQKLPQMIDTASPKADLASNLNKFSALIFEKLNLPPARTCLLEKLVRNSYQNKRNICLVCGGETTVTVRGSGVGGRNQEMALAFALHSAQWQQYGDLEVTFLSAGTDGIDGPTEAAGAIGVATIIEEAICQGLNGLYHLVTGHTGTNVMDVQILTFCWKVSVNENT